MKTVRLLLLVSIVCLMTADIIAQTNTPFGKKFLRSRDNIERIQQLGFNISTPTIIILDATDYNPQFGVTYKRYLKDISHLWKVGVWYEYYRTEGDETVIETNSLGFISSLDKEREQAINIKAGYQHFIGNKKVRIFVGADVLNGIGLQKLAGETNVYVADNDSTAGIRYALDPALSSAVETKNTFYRVGLSPFVGFNGRVTERLSFSLSGTFDMFYQLALSGTAANEFVIDKRNFVGELSMNWHF